MNITNSKELDFYRGMISDLHDGKQLSYEELVKELLVEFGIRITKKEIIEFLDPTAIDLAEDLKVLYRTIN